ncbi:long-chain fatty acid--CoA ligase [Kurthia sibirica]|uniref:Fatty-acid--CoA ligase n=1 Tax=Kurthia sibirica TaxID=202750 RepID=A0A2U3APP6_9BACL|nr:long-chain fatty acid--CoA ligase [Kurthia sibirica]PWI26512.1 fatty-acid--CoA ligase [Kurthia sibirica]GEK32756.1 long-chain-fatty-acid--CoA ligase [Kurthia sibirica]
MMDTPLVLTAFLNRAEKYFGKKQIISRTSDTKIHRITYADFAVRTRKLASALADLGMQRGMKIGSFAWNHHRHLETYFAVPCSGAILHMINIRLSAEHLIYIINHAEDEIILVDEDLLPIIESIEHELKSVKTYIIMGDDVDLSKTTLKNVLSYEQLIASADENFVFPDDLEENMTAGMCYTSATTGFPKGVEYSHRGLVLHALSLGLVETFGISEREVIMPVVPMFHVNAWGLPFASVNYGANQVLPGPNFTPKILIDLMESEKVTLTAGVPTIWLGVIQTLDQSPEPRDLSSLKLVVSGGSASPKGLIKAFEEKYNIPFIVGYGMTETSPIVSVSNYTSEMDDWTADEKLAIRATQGLTVSLIETRIVNENGEVPADGQTMGELTIRGPWIADEYYKDERTEDAFRDGWLYTGDIAVRTPEGYIKITDRTKDLIKSGGEWISSVDLENALMTHEAVFEAAVIAMPHPKWQERPLACVVLKNNDIEENSVKAQLYSHLEQDFAKWWLPDDIIFLKEIPKTSVGKFLKAKLRDDLETLLVK